MSIQLIGPMVLSLLAGGLFGVKGNGELREEVREVPGFTGVTVSGGILAELREGEPQSVKVVADANLLPLIETKVVKGVLEVRITEAVRPTERIRLVVVTPRLERLGASGGTQVNAVVGSARTLSIDGSGGARIAVAGVDAHQLRLRASGGVNVQLTGKAHSAELTASGGVKLALAGLALNEAEVDLSGGVSGELSAEKSVAGKASGGATLTVQGAPELRVKTSGGARVRRP
jgi:hypothetical protein